MPNPPRRTAKATATLNPQKFALDLAATLESRVREKQVVWGPGLLAECVEYASALRHFGVTGDDARLHELAGS